MKKVIIFDVDGVITDSGQNKEDIIQAILQKHGLFDLPWVAEIFWIWLNRVALLDKIFEIQEFDRDLVLSEINRDLAVQEAWVSLIAETYDFIKKYYKDYDLFINTSLPKSSLTNIVQSLNLSEYFMEFLCYDTGCKKENIEYVMQVYNISAENIVFIDDKMNHINAVKDTGVNTLLFVDDGVSLEEKLSHFLK